MTVRSPVRWRQREATRAVKAAEEAGLVVTGIECCPDGRIIVHTSKERQSRVEPNRLEIVL
jgi:hypothetical protein